MLPLCVAHSELAACPPEAAYKERDEGHVGSADRSDVFILICNVVTSWRMPAQNLTDDVENNAVPCLMLNRQLVKWPGAFLELILGAYKKLE